MIRNLKIWLSYHFTLIALAAVLTIASVTKSEASDKCFRDWAEAAKIVHEESLLDVESLSRQFKRQKVGDIVKTQLCRIAGKYEYQVVIRSPRGRFSSKTFDARLGIEIGVAGTE